MKNPDPLGDRYPVSGPSWRTVVRHCERLTDDAEQKAKREHQKHRRNIEARDQKLFSEGLSPEARAMQEEIDKGSRR